MQHYGHTQAHTPRYNAASPTLHQELRLVETERKTMPRTKSGTPQVTKRASIADRRFAKVPRREVSHNAAHSFIPFHEKATPVLFALLEL